MNFSPALFGVAQTPSEGPFWSGSAIWLLSVTPKPAASVLWVSPCLGKQGLCGCRFVFLLCVAPNLPFHLMCGSQFSSSRCFGMAPCCPQCLWPVLMLVLWEQPGAGPGSVLRAFGAASCPCTTAWSHRAFSKLSRKCQ